MENETKRSKRYIIILIIALLLAIGGLITWLLLRDKKDEPPPHEQVLKALDNAVAMSNENKDLVSELERAYLNGRISFMLTDQDKTVNYDTYLSQKDHSYASTRSETGPNANKWGWQLSDGSFAMRSSSYDLSAYGFSVKSLDALINSALPDAIGCTKDSFKKRYEDDINRIGTSQELYAKTEIECIVALVKAAIGNDVDLYTEQTITSENTNKQVRVALYNIDAKETDAMWAAVQDLYGMKTAGLETYMEAAFVTTAAKGGLLTDCYIEDATREEHRDVMMTQLRLLLKSADPTSQIKIYYEPGEYRLARIEIIISGSALDEDVTITATFDFPHAYDDSYVYSRSLTFNGSGEFFIDATLMSIRKGNKTENGISWTEEFVYQDAYEKLTETESFNYNSQNNAFEWNRYLGNDIFTLNGKADIQNKVTRIGIEKINQCGIKTGVTFAIEVEPGARMPISAGFENLLDKKKENVADIIKVFIDGIPMPLES